MAVFRDSGFVIGDSRGNAGSNHQSPIANHLLV